MHKLMLLSFLVVFCMAPGAMAFDQTDANAPVPAPVPMPEDVVCPDIVINGSLGSGAPGWPAFSGEQTGRLNRNGVSSLCGAPKSCAIWDTNPGRAFDAYAIANESGAMQCVNVSLLVHTQTACNIQTNAYLNTYVPTSVCTGYLADPGLSTGTPPNLLTLSFDVPANDVLIMVVHTTNPGEFGCEYTLTISGELCGGSTAVEPGTWGAIKDTYK